MSTRSSLDRLVSEEVFCKAVIGLLVGMPVVELFTEFLCRFNDMIIPSFFQPQILALFGMFGTVLTVLYWIASVPSKRKLRMADIFYLTLLFFMIISAVFSLNPGVYSYGMMFYCENPLHFLAYYWLYFAGTLIDNVKYRIRILYAYLIVAVLEVTVAFLHTFDIEIIPCTTYRAPHAAYGLAVNSNFYGGMSVIFVACATGVFIFAESFFESKIKRCILLAFTSLAFYTLLASRARLAWVGMAGLIAFYVISLCIMYRKAEDKNVLRPAIKRSLILLGAFLVVFGIAFFFTDYIHEAVVRSYWEVANDNVDAIGSDRIYNWRMGLSSVPDHWLTGVGLDNYRYVFVSAPDYEVGMYIQDKGHNEYIHTLVTQGVPALINYLALLIFAASGAVKYIMHEASRKKREVLWVFLGIFIAYCSQALLNSSVTYVVIYFWLVIGIITPRTALRTQKNN